MNEYVAVYAEKTDAFGANHTLALIQTGNVNVLGFVASEASQLILDSVAKTQGAALLDVARTKLAHSLLVRRAAFCA